MTLAPTPVRPRPPPTATSQPSDSSTGIDSAAARAPVGSTTSGWRLQPSFGPPISSRRSASWPLSAGGASGPAAHTTTAPSSQLAWRRTSRAGSAAAIAATGSATRGQQVVGGLEGGELLLEVGDDLVPLGPVDLADVIELVLDVVEHALERAPPTLGIRLQLGQLVRCGRALGSRPCGVLERTCCVLHRGPAPLGRGFPGRRGREGVLSAASRRALGRGPVHRLRRREPNKPQATPGRRRCGNVAQAPGATRGHGRARSTARATSNSRASSWCRPRTCMPTGRPSTVPAGIETAGFP